eukprot:1159587-Pelagomonas_calceolata.AAC.6
MDEGAFLLCYDIKQELWVQKLECALLQGISTNEQDETNGQGPINDQQLLVTGHTVKPQAILLVLCKTRQYTSIGLELALGSIADRAGVILGQFLWRKQEEENRRVGC